MKISLQEHDGCFAFDLSAESLADAALLVRLGTGALKQVRTLGATAYKDGSVVAYLVIGKSRKADSVGEIG